MYRNLSGAIWSKDSYCRQTQAHNRSKMSAHAQGMNMVAGLEMRKFLRVATFTAFLVPAAAAAQDIDVQATISRLVQSEQTSIDFTEIRFSPMLKEPLMVSGTLGYIGPQSLDRHVLTPYREDSEIRSDTVKVSREGEPDRTFALRRAPELRELLHVFSALLAGDHATLSRDFVIEAKGTTQDWQLGLTPRDTGVSELIQQIRISGHGDSPQCFWMFRDENSFSVMLLGMAAHTDLPHPLTVEWLQTSCST